MPARIQQMAGYNSRSVHNHSEYYMQWCYFHTFISSHWLPTAESTTSTLCMNGYPYKILLPHFQSCDGEWWGGRWAGVCGRRESGPPILNGVLRVGQSTQVSWRRPGDPDRTSWGQWLQWDYPWDTHCSKENGIFPSFPYTIIIHVNACVNGVRALEAIITCYEQVVTHACIRWFTTMSCSCHSRFRVRGDVGVWWVQVTRRGWHPIGETATPVGVGHNALILKQSQPHMHMQYKNTTTIRTTQVKEAHNGNHKKQLGTLKSTLYYMYIHGASVSTCGEHKVKEEAHSVYACALHISTFYAQSLLIEYHIYVLNHIILLSIEGSKHHNKC